MEPFKNIYNRKSIKSLSAELVKLSKGFNEKEFLDISCRNLDELEMKQRVEQISMALESQLKGSYKQNVKLLCKSINSGKLSGFILWPYSVYIEKNGINDFKTSMDALSLITKKWTAEFGVRVFFDKYPKETYDYLSDLKKADCEHLRRWVSEGTRPNLPWGKNISHLSNNLPKNIKLISSLRNDNSEYVRKSVANHMNDIGWLNEKLVTKTLKQWNKESSKEVKWVVKHALRNLLKNGNKDALEIMGYSPKFKSVIKKLRLSKKMIKEGDSIDLEFDIKNIDTKKTNLMIDYIIHYPKANGTTSAKVFKCKNIALDKNDFISIKKKINFKVVTTRRHYPGVHKVELQVNGKVLAETKFTLKK